jgi:hypothetical protein
MYSAEQSGVVSRPTSLDRVFGDTRSIIRQTGMVMLQVDATVSRIHGLAWLTNQRESDALLRLAEVQAQAAAEGWTPERLVAARLSVIRPRRSEINALGRAYLEAVAPDAAEAAHRIRRAGIAVGLSSDVAVEALFGVATALGVTPEDIHAPTLRFDALGFFTGSEMGRRSSRPADGFAGAAERADYVFIGTRPPELGRQRGVPFVSFTGFVEQDGHLGTPALDSVGSFAELATLVTG